jgi:hypothetical protein
MAKPQPEIAAPLAIPKEQYGTGGRARPLEHYADRRPPIVGTTLAGVALRLNSYPLPEMVGGCRWIENEPQGRHTVFCDARRKAGSSYCPAHHRICWVKAPRRDNAA